MKKQANGPEIKTNSFRRLWEINVYYLRLICVNSFIYLLLNSVRTFDLSWIDASLFFNISSNSCKNIRFVLIVVKTQFDFDRNYKNLVLEVDPGRLTQNMGESLMINLGPHVQKIF